jgi:hypothetical protein
VLAAPPLCGVPSPFSVPETPLDVGPFVIETPGDCCFGVPLALIPLSTLIFGPDMLRAFEFIPDPVPPTLCASAKPDIIERPKTAEISNRMTNLLDLRKRATLHPCNEHRRRFGPCEETAVKLW